jgi:UDP-glucose 4-epimerase
MSTVAAQHRLSASRWVVTGGLGFIGSAVVARLVAQGAHVTVVDALVPTHGGDPANVAGLDVDVVVADIGAPEVADAVAGADVVVNAAGQVSHLSSMVEPMRDLDLNVRSHLAFLETLRRVCPGVRIVQTSTRQVYGRPRYLPVDEDHPTAPVDVNGIDKLACEQFHLLYHQVHGLQATALRLTNVYGPRQHLEREGLGFLPVFVRRALLDEEISLFGDGSQRRDCLHVDDVVDAIVACAVAADTAGEVVNLGHPEALTLSEIARHTLDAAGASADVRLVPWPDDLSRIDIGSFQGDYSKAKRMFGWEPRVSFPDGIRSTVEHYRERGWSPSST